MEGICHSSLTTNFYLIHASFGVPSDQFPAPPLFICSSSTETLTFQQEIINMLLLDVAKDRDLRPFLL